ncbi:hypothetical protein DFJ74DRAFT_666784 [Hyaloraphidium curvatum]|nr:hypothetical protein DFJ74DRAFT_666784 [Hyaloraphidium curvatum]
MASTAVLLKTFGAYVIGAGLGLTFAPATLQKVIETVLKPTSLPGPSFNEETAGTLGPVVTALGLYYYGAGIDDNTAFAKRSVPGRVAFAALLAINWYRGVIPSGTAVVFGATDLVFAYLTRQSLQKEGK